VIDDIQKKLVRREMQPGEKLPSVRELALAYQINPNTASRVYREMESLGLCATKRGLGTFMTEDKNVLDKIRNEMANEYLDNFINGMQVLGFDFGESVSLLRERYDKEDV
jgi:DNA-binding transcriptional regulator YhcF (GntR family)